MPKDTPRAGKQPWQHILREIFQTPPSHKEYLADNVGGGLRIRPPLRITRDSRRMLGIQRLKPRAAINFVHTTPCPARTETLRAARSAKASPSPAAWKCLSREKSGTRCPIRSALDRTLVSVEIVLETATPEGIWLFCPLWSTQRSWRSMQPWRTLR